MFLREDKLPIERIMDNEKRMLMTEVISKFV